MNIVYDMPAQAYHEVDAWSASKLKRFRHCPAAVNVPLSDDTGVLAFGTAAHSLILEGKRAHVVAPKVDRRTKEGKALWEAFQADHAGDCIISADDEKLIEAMGQAVHCHPRACEILADGGVTEASLFWQDSFTGLGCKARPDLFLPDKGIIVDLKTCTDASEYGFSVSVKKYGYALQAAMYLHGMNEVLGEGVFDAFVFIAVEKVAPFRVGVYTLDSEYIAYGRELMMSTLEDVLECSVLGQWPNYLTDSIVTLAKPAYLK